MIRRVNTGQMVAQTQSVLLAHAKVVGLVLRRFFEMFGGQREQPSRIPRMPSSHPSITSPAPSLN